MMQGLVKVDWLVKIRKTRSNKNKKCKWADKGERDKDKENGYEVLEKVIKWKKTKTAAEMTSMMPATQKQHCNIVNQLPLKAMAINEDSDDVEQDQDKGPWGVGLGESS